MVVTRVQKVDEDCHGKRDQGRSCEVTVYRRAACGMEFRLSRGFPLQQSLARDEAPHQRADNCVKAKKRLVREKDEVQQGDESCLPETGERFARTPFLAADERAAEAET